MYFNFAAKSFNQLVLYLYMCVYIYTSVAISRLWQQEPDYPTGEFSNSEMFWFFSVTALAITLYCLFVNCSRTVSLYKASTLMVFSLCKKIQPSITSYIVGLQNWRGLFLFQLNIDIVCFYQLCAAHSHCKKSICFHSRSNHGVDFPMYLCGRGHLGHYIRWFVSEVFALVTFIPKLSVGALILWDQDSALMANFRTQSSVNLLRWYFF